MEVAGTVDLPGVGLAAAREALQQRGLADAVAAHQRHPPTGSQGHGDVAESTCARGRRRVRRRSARRGGGGTGRPPVRSPGPDPGAQSSSISEAFFRRRPMTTATTPKARTRTRMTASQGVSAVALPRAGSEDLEDGEQAHVVGSFPGVVPVVRAPAATATSTGYSRYVWGPREREVGGAALAVLGQREHQDAGGRGGCQDRQPQAPQVATDGPRLERGGGVGRVAGEEPAPRRVSGGPGPNANAASRRVPHVAPSDAGAMPLVTAAPSARSVAAALPPEPSRGSSAPSSTTAGMTTAHPTQTVRNRRRRTGSEISAAHNHRNARGMRLWRWAWTTNQEPGTASATAAPITTAATTTQRRRAGALVGVALVGVGPVGVAVGERRRDHETSQQEHLEACGRR